MKDFWYF